MQKHEKITPIRILISGDPGSGGSTLATRLTEALVHKNFEKLSGGTLRRAETYHWADFKQQEQETAAMMGQPPISEATLWKMFENMYIVTYSAQGVNGLLDMLQPYFNKPSNNAYMLAFNAAQKEHSNNPLFWDISTDAYLYELIHQASDKNLILESKLAVALPIMDELIQAGAITAAFEFFKIVLTVTPEAAGPRITGRETGEPITAEEADRRRKDDWARYSTLYHVDGKPLTHEMLEAQGFVIDTSDITAEEVLQKALYYIAVVSQDPTIASLITRTIDVDDSLSDTLNYA